MDHLSLIIIKIIVLQSCLSDFCTFEFLLELLSSSLLCSDEDGQGAVIVTNQLSSATYRRLTVIVFGTQCQKISGRVRTLESKAQMAEAVILLISRSQSTEAWWESSLGSVVAHPHFSLLPGSYAGADLDIFTLGR